MAIQAVKANPQITPRMAQLLDEMPTLPARVREQTLDQILLGLDQVEAEATAQGQQIGEQITLAIKHAFTDSISSIYRYAIVLAALALLLALFVPEIPLRRSNTPGEQQVAQLDV